MCPHEMCVPTTRTCAKPRWKGIRAKTYALASAVRGDTPKPSTAARQDTCPSERRSAGAPAQSTPMVGRKGGTKAASNTRPKFAT